MKSKLKIIAFIFSILISSCGDGKKNAEETRPEIISQNPINNKGVFIDHKIHGSGEYTLLFIHGWCINQSYWDEQVKSLQSEYRIVTIDLPGFGESGKNRKSWSIEKYGEDVNAVIEQLKLTNVILIGHSMGGNVAVEAALKNQNIIAVIGIDNFKDLGVEYDQDIKDQINDFMELLKNNFSAIAPAYAEGSLFHSSTSSIVKNRVMNDFKNSDSIAAISSLEALISYGNIESDQLRKLNQKLYLINSNASPTDKSGLEETGIDFQVVEIDSTGHFPMIEKPVEFNTLLKQTIKKIEMAARNNTYRQ